MPLGLTFILPPGEPCPPSPSPRPSPAVAFQLHYPTLHFSALPQRKLGAGGQYLLCPRLKGDKLGRMKYLMFAQAFGRLCNAAVLRPYLSEAQTTLSSEWQSICIRVLPPAVCTAPISSQIIWRSRQKLLTRYWEKQKPATCSNSGQFRLGIRFVS